MPIANFRCKGCTERYPGCHAHCEKYKEDKAAHDKARHEEYLKNQAKMYTYRHVGDIRDGIAKNRKSQSGYMRFSKGTG